MPDDYEFSRVLQFAVDAWRYGTRDDRQQFELQRHMAEAVSVAAARSGLDWPPSYVQDQGDGLLALLPDSMAEPVLVDPFVRELDTWLSRHNHDRQPPARLRLRLAIHHGPAILAETGVASQAVVHVCRLRDSRPAHEALDAAPEANLVQVLSARIFEDVIQQRHTSLSTNDFTRVEIADEAKGFAATAWIRVPGLRLATSGSNGEVLAVSLRFLMSPRKFPAIVDQVLIPSFAAAGIALPGEVSFEGDDPVACLPGVSVQLMLGQWIEYVGDLIESHARGMRMVVGVCTSFEPMSARREARELASLDQAARVISGARGSQVVIVVSGHVYDEISRNPGRLVMPETYGPAGSSWLRVLGYARPPQPADRVRNGPGGELPPGGGSVTAIGNRATAIGGGRFDSLQIGDVHHHGGAD